MAKMEKFINESTFGYGYSYIFRNEEGGLHKSERLYNERVDYEGYDDEDDLDEDDYNW